MRSSVKRDLFCCVIEIYSHGVADRHTTCLICWLFILYSLDGSAGTEQSFLLLISRGFDLILFGIGVLSIGQGGGVGYEN